MLRRLLLVITILAACVATVQHIRSRALPQLRPAAHPHPHPLARGAYHVHSESSHDSSVTLEQIARAARETGLAFVIVTDHNNQLAGPVEIGGVTILSYAELSTPSGHVVQLAHHTVPDRDTRRHPDLLRLLRDAGALPVVAHPSDRKRPWTGPIQDAAGIEITNTASEARRLGGPVFVGLLPSLLAWRLHPKLALAQLYDRDAAALRRWDSRADSHFVGLCGIDAHGRIDLATNMRAWQIVLRDALPRENADRPAAILEALSHGRFTCATGLLGDNSDLSLTAVAHNQRVAEIGDTLPAARIDALVARAPHAASGEAPTLVLLRNGVAVARTQETPFTYKDPLPGSYRVEILASIPGILFGSRLQPVMYSNRITLQADATVDTTQRAEPTPNQPRGAAEAR